MENSRQDSTGKAKDQHGDQNSEPKEMQPIAGPESDSKFIAELTEIYKQLRFGRNLKKSMKQVEKKLLKLMDATYITIYQSMENGDHIWASFMGGNSEIPEVEIKTPFGPSSLAGYVAQTQRPLLVKNVYDKDELASIHPDLKWNHTFSEGQELEFKSMVVVPIKDGILLGVLQLIRVKTDDEYNDEDLKHAIMLAQILAKQFRAELQSTQGPYDYLVQQGMITSKELDEVQSRAALYGNSVTRILMDEYSIEDSQIGKSLEFFYRVPYMSYDPEVSIPGELLSNISTTYLRNNLWLPVSGNKEEVVILIDDPGNHKKITEIKGIINAKNYVFKVGIPEHILMYLGKGLEEYEEIAGFEDVFKSLEEEVRFEDKNQDDDLQDDETAAGSSAIIQLVSRVIIEADRRGSSDIHIEPGRGTSPGIVRIRVDGICRELLRVPSEYTSPMIARIKVISRLDISERRLPQDGKCHLKIRGRSIELRVATMPTVNGESAVLRIFSAGGAMPLEQLNLDEENYRKIKKLASKPHGLLLLVGPTGSGKTTTLHGILGYLNSPERKIWTAEDPVEITQPGLQQVQMHPKIGFTFAAAMRSFLRADPDIILIGEMRDHETASIAIEASLTGHLVLSTLHTNSAPETIIRLLDLGLDPINFSDSLLGIMAQRLIRTLCEECKEEYSPEEREVQHLVDQYGGEEAFAALGIDRNNVKLCRAVGCEECGNTGYLGRTAIHELLQGTRELQRKIYNKSSWDMIRDQAVADGMRTLKQDGIAKIFQGQTDYEQLLRVVAE